MLRFLGNTLSKSCRKGRLQNRDFSSVSEKAVSKFYGYCFGAAFGGTGFLLACVTTSPVSKGNKEYEERFIKDMRSIEETHDKTIKLISSIKKDLEKQVK